MASAAGEEMVIMPLGGGQEVGRSCILLQYQSRNILLDCGCHPGREGSDSLPFFDSLDNPEDIDLILITHFHIDHCAALPYFTERTNFKGKILMTHATKAVMKLLLSDNIRLNSRHPPLYNEQDLQNCIDKIDVINYHQTVEHRGIKVTATAAGHVLGAAMFTIDIDNIKVLYTGDYSMEEDRHLLQAEIPPGGPPDVLIVESTFGTTTLPSREKREAEFTRAVEMIVSRGGSCLIPVFALGRAQELLLILEAFWQDNPDLHHIPIYYASKLANKSLRVYQTFVNMMNAQVRRLADVYQNPFQLRHIRSLERQEVDLFGPCVVMASPGFLQSGVSRQLFETWCDNERHGVIIAGYTVEGTLANDLLSMPNEVRCLDNRIKPRRCAIEHISFSAHVDYNQNRGFIRSVLPDYIVLVHGERTQMKRLREALETEVRRNWPSSHKPSIATPENGVKVKLRFRKNIVADVVGSVAVEVLQQLESVEAAGLASSATQQQQSVGLPPQTVLVTENFSSRLLSARDLPQMTSCRVGAIKQRLVVAVPADIAQMLVAQAPTHQSFEGSQTLALALIARQLRLVYEEVQVESAAEAEQAVVVVEGVVTVRLEFGISAGSAKEVTLKALVLTWTASPVADMVADSVLGLLTQLLSAPSLVRRAVAAGASQMVGGRRATSKSHGDEMPTQKRRTDASIP